MVRRRFSARARALRIDEHRFRASMSADLFFKTCALAVFTVCNRCSLPKTSAKTLKAYRRAPLVRLRSIFVAHSRAAHVQPACQRPEASRKTSKNFDAATNQVSLSKLGLRTLLFLLAIRPSSQRVAF